MKNSHAVIRNGKIVYGDESITVQGNPLQAKFNRESMKTKYRKDLLQKNQTAYYKAYPEQAKNLNPELRRLLS